MTFIFLCRLYFVKYRQITNIQYFEFNFFFTIFADNYAAKDSYFSLTDIFYT